MHNQLNFLYDHEADVLYVSSGHPTYTNYVELNDDVILRLDPKTNQVVGFTIVDFAGRFSKNAPALALPLHAASERKGKVKRPRVIAERKATYAVKREKRTRKRAVRS